MKKKITYLGSAIFMISALLFSPSGIGLSTLVLATCSPGGSGGNFSSGYMGRYGGVSLDKAATFLTDMSDVTGAYFDQATNRIVFIGKDLPVNQTPVFNKDDLAVAIRSVILNNTNPAVSMGDPNNLSAVTQPVQYFGGIEKTNFGDILARADYDLKRYYLGTNSDNSPVTSAVSGYSSAPARYYAKNPASNDVGGGFRIYIEPDYLTLKADTVNNSFVFDQVKMEVLQESSPNSSTLSVQARQEFADHFTNNYDSFAAESQWLSKTKELSKIVGVVKWVKDSGIVSDFNWAKNYKPNYVNSWDTVQFWDTPQVNVNGTLRAVRGGVSFMTPNTYNSDNGTSSTLKGLSQSAAPSLTSDHWSFTQSGQTYNSVAVSANAFRSVGTYTTEATDMSIDTLGEFNLDFKRHYSSLSSTSGEIGNGWDYKPARLKSINKNVALLCLPAYGYQGFYQKQLAFETSDGIYDTFTFDCPTGRYTSDKDTNTSFILRAQDGRFAVITRDNREFSFDNGVFVDEFKLLDLQDRNSKTITYNYSNTPYITSITDQHNRSITLNRNTSGVITSISDWTGRTVTYGYDSNGNLISVTDPRGNAVAYTYDSKGRLVTATNRQSQTVLSNTYDDENRLVNTTNGAGLTTSFDYDETNRMLTATDENNRVAKTYYDDKIRITKQVDPLNNYAEFTYGTNYAVPTIERDKNGNVTTRTLTSWGAEETVTYPNGKQVAKTYNDYLLVDSVTDGRYGSNPKITSSVSDDWGNFLSTTVAGVTSTFTYDNRGNQLTSTDALNHTTTKVYDTFGHVLTSTDAANKTTSNTYDSLGRLTNVVDPNGKTKSFTYDNNNNTVTTTNGSGTTTNTYNADNRLTKTIDPSSRTTELTYAVSGAQSATKDPMLNMTTYGYDEYDKLVSKQDALNHTTQYQYDLMNRQKQSTTPLGKVAKWEYDANNNLTKRTDESNRDTTYEYDSLDRLKKITYPDSSIVTNTYDDRGNLTQAVSPAGTSTYTYDVFDRLLSETDPNNNTTSYTYDNVGNLLTTTYPDSKAVTNTYDNTNRLLTTTDWNSQQTTYQYNDNGTLSSKQLPNGITASYSYDSSNQVSALEYSKNSALVTRYEYVRDATGAVTSEIEVKDAPIQSPGASFQFYGDSLTSGWNTSSSYNTTLTMNDTPAYQGTSALGYTATNWGYVDIRKSSGNQSASGYSTITFAAKASQPGQKVHLRLQGTTSSTFKKVDISLYGGALSSTRYKVYNIPLAALGGVNAQIKALQFSNETSSSQPKIYLDNIQLTTIPQVSAVVYDDALTAGFQQYPWGSGTLSDLNDMTSPQGGTSAIGLTHGQYGGLILTDSVGIDTTGYSHLTFSVKGSAANQDMYVKAVNSSGVEVGTKLTLSTNLGGVPTVGSYKTYYVPISSLQISNSRFYGFALGNETSVAQPEVQVDNIGLVTSTSGVIGNQLNSNYSYDSNGRVTSASLPNSQSFSYTYDAVGNRLNSVENGVTTSQTYNNDNQLTSRGTRIFTYDNQGNQITDATKSFTYNFDNRLTLWSNSSPNATVSYTYDASGTRIGKTGGGATRQFVNSTVGENANVLVDKNMTNSTQTFYQYGDSLISQGGATTANRQYLLPDAMGNTRIVTDNTGANVHIYSYDPYGNEISSSTATNYSFQKYEKDRENNLSYLRARYYDPTTGRFLSKDPHPGALSVSESQNGYSYAHNDPVNQTDPSGEVIPALIYLAGAAIAMSDMQNSINNCDTGGAAVASLGFIPIVGNAGKAMNIIFKTAHVANQADHLRAGISIATMEASIRSHLLKNPLSQQYETRTIILQGMQMEYRAYRLPDGTINVGTYFFK
jgi:RHS repeat-associated protein